MNYIGLNKFDTANGEGIRVSLFVSGCTLRCKGCFNEESWDFKAGKEFTEDTLNEVIDALSNGYVSGLSVLGGDPLEEKNIDTVTEICKAVKDRFNGTKSIWLWTGRVYDKYKDYELFKYIDVVIDGPYIAKYKVSGGRKPYGSTNQRVIKITEI